MSRINTLYPRLVVSDGAKAVDFYVAAFGAEYGERHTDGGGKIVHIELTLGDGITVALKDEGDGDPAPTSLGGSPVILALDVDDADALGDAMVAAGALRPSAPAERSADGTHLGATAHMAEPVCGDPKVCAVRLARLST